MKHRHELIAAAKRIAHAYRNSAGYPSRAQENAFLVARHVLVEEGVEPLHWPAPEWNQVKQSWTA